MSVLLESPPIRARAAPPEYVRMPPLPFVTLKHVSKGFGSRSQRRDVLKDLNLDIARGEFVAIVGHSGCGKSMVLSMIAGLNEPTGGGIVLAGREVTDAGPDRGVVFQAPFLLPWMTALQNIPARESRGRESFSGRRTHRSVTPKSQGVPPNDRILYLS